MRKGFEHEMEFWKDFVKTDRFRDNWQSDTRNPELSQHVVNILQAETGIAGHQLKIADIGSGAASILRGAVPASIQCADPLGWYYSEIGCPGVLSASGEDLPRDVFKTGSYDVAHISNAIDHSENPMCVLAELIRITRPGGLVIVQGFENEAYFENYAGLHQYNFGVDKERLICNGGDISFTYTQKAGVLISRVDTLVTGRRWFIFAFRKPTSEE
jgi:SAM-dependent methyltransferase